MKKLLEKFLLCVCLCASGGVWAEDFDLKSFRTFWTEFRAAAITFDLAVRAETAGEKDAQAAREKAFSGLAAFLSETLEIAPEGADWADMPKGSAAPKEKRESLWSDAVAARVETGARHPPTLMERIRSEPGFSDRQWENCQRYWRLEGGFCGHGDFARFESLRFGRGEAGWKVVGWVGAESPSVERKKSRWGF